MSKGPLPEDYFIPSTEEEVEAYLDALPFWLFVLFAQGVVRVGDRMAVTKTEERRAMPEGFSPN